MKMEAFDRFNFYQNYRQRYTVIPITTVRGPFSFPVSLAVQSHNKPFVYVLIDSSFWFDTIKLG